MRFLILISCIAFSVFTLSSFGEKKTERKPMLEAKVEPNGLKSNQWTNPQASLSEREAFNQVLAEKLSNQTFEMQKLLSLGNQKIRQLKAIYEQTNKESLAQLKQRHSLNARIDSLNSAKNAYWAKEINGQSPETGSLKQETNY